MLEATTAHPNSSLPSEPGQAAIVRIAVVIPFFQRKTGILARALQSIKDQRFTQSVAIEVLVVDDGSPLNPGDECDAAGFDGQLHLRLIERSNGGPGVGRNTGLV